MMYNPEANLSESVTGGQVQSDHEISNVYVLFVVYCLLYVVVSTMFYR